MKKIFPIVILLQLFFRLCAFAQVYDAVLLNQQTDIELLGTKLIKRHAFTIQVNNRAGEKYTEVGILYSTLTHANKIQASVTDISGNLIKKLKSQDIKKRSAISNISLYEDRMIYEFTLKHNVYPYILTYSYEESENQFLYIDYWCPVLAREIPTLKATLTLNLPHNYEIRFASDNIKTEKKDSLKNQIIYKWVADYKALSVAEIYAPDASTYYPTVKIVPVDFVFKQKGRLDSWKNYGNWQYNINSSLLELPDNEKAKISSLIDGITDNTEKLKILYHYLQDATRYINVSVKTGGMVPYPASYVATNKYGDCKALSNYFLAVLQHAGIKSHYSKIYADNRIRPMDKSFPSQQSNHIIVCIPTASDTLWLDCTSNGPFGYLGTFTQGRDVFIIDKDKSRWTKTPGLKPSDVEECRYITCSYNGHISTAGFKNRIKGAKFEKLAYLAKEYNSKTQELIIRNNFIENGFELLTYELLPAHRDSLFINLNFKAQTDKVYQLYGNDMAVKAIRFDIPKFTKPSERKFPVQLDYPICRTDSQVFIIPPGYSAPHNTRNDSLESVFGKYSLKMIVKDQEMIVVKSFMLNNGNYALDDYPAFYNFIKQVNDKENNSVFLLNKI